MKRIPPWLMNWIVWVVTWACMVVTVGTLLYVLLHFICLCFS